MTKTDFEQQLTARLQALAHMAPDQPRLSHEPRPDAIESSRRVLIGAACLTALMMVVFAVSQIRSNSESQVEITTERTEPDREVSGTETTEQVPSQQEPTNETLVDNSLTVLPEGWTAVEIPNTVAAWGEVLVWSGEELLFWGGQDATSNNVPDGEPGSAYDPNAGTWRSLPPSPKPATAGAAGVWTGDAMIITGGATSNGRIPSAVTVGFDPSTDTWSELADNPVPSEYNNAVWSGTEMIVVGTSGVAIYQPETDGWRLASAPPSDLGRLREIAWTGEELIVWPTPVQRVVRRGFALDVDADTWRVLPDPPAWPATPDLAWTGNRLIIWGALPAPGADDSERAVGSIYNPATDTWSELPEPLPEPDGCECNIGSQTLIWTGSHLVVSTGHLASGLDSSTSAQLLRFDPQENEWRLLGPSPLSFAANALMADQQIVVRSGTLFLAEPNWIPDGEPVP